jgi:hypothetical protein
VTVLDVVLDATWLTLAVGWLEKLDHRSVEGEGADSVDMPVPRKSGLLE